MPQDLGEISMRRMFCILMLFTIIASSGSIVQLTEAVFYTNRIAGVSAGDWARFADFSVNYTSNDPSPPLGEDQMAFGMQSIVVTVKDVSGKEMTFEVSLNFLNGTELAYTEWVDVEIGSGVSGLTPFFISSNLTSGDRIYLSNNFAQYEIDGTAQLTYVEEIREVTYLNLTTVQLSGEYDITTYMEFYWDKLSGMLCEFKILSNYTMESTGYMTLAFFSARIEQTNLWGPTLEGDITHDGKVDIYDIMAIVQFYGSRKGDPDWNPETDLAPPYKVVDLLDLVTCGYHYGETYP